MNKSELIDLLSSKIKLIRIENNFTQDEMSNIIGVSKKSLVEIEKGRKKLSWSLLAAICAIFRESEILKMTLGDDPVELISLIALEKFLEPKKHTIGGKIWWKDILSNDKFTLQQNIVSGHYRILDSKKRRWYSSMNKIFIEKKYNELITE
ncbi:helix-turn-helix transcriptional regulator [Abyssisolibacter fermentans]|uniref:helix-turn-helix transcriptional regulator n=1 Tax=Abyssisolibacter fermentans TaxID=1766203 RepID=UPI0008356D11|nr:helix-turn-helix domain-containing protein [Abyssisolibacter fermentans]